MTVASRAESRRLSFCAAFRTARYMTKSFLTVSDDEIPYPVLRLLARSLVVFQELHDLISKLVFALATSTCPTQAFLSQLKRSLIVLFKEVKRVLVDRANVRHAT